MNNKLVITITMVSVLFYFTSCNNGTSTADSKDSSTTTMTDSSSTAMKDTSSSTTMGKKDGMMEPMTMMVDKMSAVKMTGDLDNDFAALMVEHHKAAVDISEMEAAKGSDASMKKMATNMIADHKAEIEQLQSFMNHHDQSPEHKNDKGAAHTHQGGSESDLAEAIKTETSKMKDIKTTGNSDKDYEMLMQAHHEDAIKMSKAEVAHGHHAELKKMAQKMMADDEKEVKTFKDYLSSNK